MPSRIGSRLVTVAVSLAGASAGVFVITGSAAATAVAAVGGIVAVLAAAAASDEADEPAWIAPPAASDAPATDWPAVLEALLAPVLLVEGGRVTLANAGARALLGRHILGEDVRVAIRHPAAAERLAGRGEAGPISLVGLGMLDQRWEMRVHDVGAVRVVQLIDQTGSYAAERMRVDFVANASHELRTPLASILGYVETLQDEAGADPAIRARFLRTVQDEARRMQRLIEDLLSLSRIEAEKYRLPDRAVDLGTLAREVCAELRDTAGGRGHDLVLAGPREEAIVQGDKAQLSQMLHNLVGNAMKYGRPGAPVRLSVGADDGAGMWRVTVADEGDGIAPQHIPRLTERFYRADAGRSRSLGGTGLGLAIVKHIVERHRGRLEIASTLGVGTTVTVVLPRSRMTDE